MGYLREIQDFNRQNRIRIAVIDDDPTGCQTVHSVPLLTDWSSVILKEAFDKNETVFLLTNSRALSPSEASGINRDVASCLGLSMKEGWKLRIISRSDSTLRGHFMEEISALTETSGPYDGIVIAPFFMEAGRMTFNDTHYVFQSGKYIPVAETEFAKDPLFGYSASSLPEWIEEKSDGKWKKEDVISVSIDDIRNRGPEFISAILEKTESARPVIINALNYSDLETAVWAICLAEKKGKRFLYRTAASFVKTRAGIESKEIICPAVKSPDLLIVAGSYTNKTTSQINELCRHSDIIKAEISVRRILTSPEAYMSELINFTDMQLSSGKNVMLATERNYYNSGTDSENQKMSAIISLFLAGIVAGLESLPGTIISKGGITSHHIMREGLGVRHAEVLGQIEPGVPLLRLPASGKAPGSYFVIFPGNVGEEDTLLKIVTKLVSS
ncbi:MAG: hypothetical protein JXA55_00940 [Bacteroidales bacterium]|nr:hypothetical protein [Bacteroidales bacterium]